MKKLLCTAMTVALLASPAPAELTVDVAGVPGNNHVGINFGGSTDYSGASASFTQLGWQDFGNFVPQSVGGLPALGEIKVSGGPSGATVTGQISGIAFDDGGNGAVDDFFVSLTSPLSLETGDVPSWYTEFIYEIGITDFFGGTSPRTFTASNALGDLELTITNKFQPVPPPAPLPLAPAALGGLALLRRRKS